MKCEIIREGQACNFDATCVVRTPWSKQYACDMCTQSFRRYDVRPCDVDGVELNDVTPSPQPRVVQEIGGVVRLWCHCGAPGRFRANSDDTMPLCDKHAPRTSFLRKFITAARQMLERMTGARARKAAAVEAEMIRRTVEAKAQARRKQR